jgi:hypothetical protein
MLWILSRIFFGHYTNEESVERFRIQIQENIFLAMETSKQSYLDILNMPVDRLKKYFQWKQKFDEEVAKQREAALKDAHNKK